MTFNEYQEKASKTAIYHEKGNLGGLMYCALGLGESGEVQGKIKKLFRDGGYSDLEKRYEIGKELGDLLWYIANTAKELGLELEDIAQDNLDKLASRAARGVLSGSGDNR